MQISEHFKKIFSVKKEIFEDIIGQERTKKQLMSALLMDRHVIIVGAPGIGKTTLVKNLAKLLPDLEVIDECEYHCTPEQKICPACKSLKKIKTKKIKGSERFVRIQGSPDLSAEDLLGDIDPVKALKFGPLSMEAFTPGKIFKANNGILFFDEINRCPEKLQNALLQVLEEGKSTLSSYDVELPSNFIFIGTMNPEDTGTEKLSDVFVDRFDFIYMGYPENVEIEKRIVLEKGEKLADFPDNLLALVVHFVRLLREDEKLSKKPSVRASIGLYERAQSNAFLKNKKAVGIDDIVEAVVSVLSHRIELKPSIKFLQNPADFIKEEFGKFLDNYKEYKEMKEEKGDDFL